MKVASLVYIYCLMAIYIGSQSSAQDQNAAERWLEQRYHADARTPDPIRLTWLETRMPLRSIAELRAELDRLADLPDHPDRTRAIFHLRLAEHPSSLERDALFAGPRAWFWSEAMTPTGDSAGSTMYYGGDGDRRWMLYSDANTPHLTVIRAGVSYPVSSDVNRFYTMMHEQLAMILSAGIPAGEVEIESQKNLPKGWEAIITHRESSRRYRIIGSWDGLGGEPIVQESISLNPDGTEQRRILFGDHEHYKGFAVPLPSRVEWIRSDGIVYEFSILDISRTDLAEVRKAGRVPEGDRLESLAPGAGVSDFGDPSSIASTSALGQRQASWTLRRSGDSVDYADPEDSFVSDPTGDQKPASKYLGRIIAIPIIIVFVSSVFIYFRRNNTI